MQRHGPDHPLVIEKLQRTTIACPSQWEGDSQDGREVYMRFRWGEFTIQVSEGRDDPLDNDPVYTWHSGEDMDSWMSDERLLGILPDWVTIPREAFGLGFVTEEHLGDVQLRTAEGLQKLLKNAEYVHGPETGLGYYILHPEDMKED